MSDLFTIEWAYFFTVVYIIYSYKNMRKSSILRKALIENRQESYMKQKAEKAREKQALKKTLNSANC